MLRAVLLPGAALCVLLLFLTALSNLQTGRDTEGKRQLEDALRRAAVACYAAEGAYPATLSHLEDRYGVQIDESRFAVSYEIFAENLMPDITVLEQMP